LERMFYMHTDLHALEHLQEEVEAIINGTVDITDIQPQYQDEVFELVIQPDNIGCGHIKLVLTHPDEYQTPSNLTKYFITAYFDFMWNHENWTKLTPHFSDFTVLEGNHTELAVLNIMLSAPIDSNCNHLAPLVVPRTPSHSLFVNHPQFVGSLRDTLSIFFSEQQGGISAKLFKSNMDSLGTIQLEKTISYLASSLPIYTATFTILEGVASNSSNETTEALWPTLIVIIIVAAIIGITYLLYRRSRNIGVKQKDVITKRGSRITPNKNKEENSSVEFVALEEIKATHPDDEQT